MNLKGISGALSAFKAAKGGDTVSSEEFQRRLAICQQCPKNVRGSRSIPTQISKWLGVQSIRFKVPKEVTNHSCGVCHCSFGLLLPALPENLHEDTQEQARQRPELCWVNSPGS